MLAGLVVVLHVLAVFWLIAGILGRDLLYGRAARSDDLKELGALVALGSLFDRTMVRPATFVVLVLGLLAAWARGWPILGVLQGASVNWVLVSLLVYLSIVPVIVWVFLPRGRAYRRAYEAALPGGRVTPELRAALNDPLVRAARTYELGMIVVLTALMVLRPF
jgi:hypothetical protein